MGRSRLVATTMAQGISEEKEEIEAAGFSFENLKMGYQKGESKTHAYLYEGVAKLDKNGA